MNKVINKPSIFLLIFALIIQSFVPLLTFAQTNEVENEAINLYSITEDIILESGISIKKGTFVYGQEVDKEQTISLQYADTYTTVPLQNLEVVETLEVEPPQFVEVDLQQTVVAKNILKDTILYSLYPDETERVLITEDIEYPVYQDEHGIEVVYLGNTAFYLSEEDRQKAKDAVESTENGETSEDEAAKEEIQSDVEEEQVDNSNENLVEETPEDSNELTEEIPQDSNEPVQEGTETLVEEETTIEQVEEKDKSVNSVQENQSLTFSSFSATLSAPVDPWKNNTANYFSVNVSDLTVYSKGNTNKLGTLTKGQVYPIDSDYGNWHQIQFGNTSGYVYKADTLPNNGTSLKNVNKSYNHSSQSFVALQNVTVYDNTSGNLVKFGTINKGERYPIVSEYGRNWSRVIFGDRVGYVLNSEVRHEFVGNENHFTVLVSNLPVYDNRSGKLIQVGTLTKGQAYEIVSDYGNWHRIQYNNHYGYVLKFNTEPSDGAYIRNKNTSYTHSDRSFTALQNAIVYDNTSGELRAFGTIDKNQTYYIASDYGNWWRIVFADRVGYVQKNKVRFNFFNSDKYFKVQIDDLAIYDNSGASLVKIGELKKGQIYPRVSGYGVNWHRVNFGDGYGYVYTEGTEFSSSSHISNLNSTYTNSNKKIVINENTEVMDNSSGKLVPFGELTEGTIYPIVTNYGDWWRIIYLDRVGYVHKNSADEHGVSESKYDLTLEEAVKIQINNANPQTDKNYAYVSKDYVVNNKVTASTLNVRGGPGTGYKEVGTLYKGNAVTVLGEFNGWYQIEYTSNQWVNASPEDVRYYLNPLNFLHDESQQFQFLDLSRASDASISVLNNFLNGKGTLHGQGQAFIDASHQHGISDVYLVSHAILETGNGSSELASGVEVGTNKSGDPVLVTSSNRGSLTNIKTVYNMFGIAAYDNSALEDGAKKAYIEDWTSPYKAIVGGANFIGNRYIKIGQNTIYKMRWDPLAMAKTGKYGKQYATDIGWAAKQVNTMYNLYQSLESYTLYLDIPVYRK